MEEKQAESKKEPPQSKRNYKPIIVFSALTVLVFIGIFIWWFGWGRFVDSTDDAYVNGNLVRLTPQITGIVTQVNVDETFFVEEGQVLIKLDETDYRIAFDKSKAQLADTIRLVTQKFEQVYAVAALYEMKSAEMVNAEVEYLDRKEVVSSGAVSEEEFIRSEAKFFSAQAAVTKVRYELMQAISEVQNTSVSTHPQVESQKENVRQAWVNLQRCTLRAPANGIVAMRKVQVGESVNPAMPLLAIVPLDQMWVDGNFKEVDLAQIRIGQPVTVTSDMYGGDVVYSGEVIGIGGGSGAVFSPLPPQNATGNWIKIVQRIPVRISLNPQQLSRFPLRLGLSMKVHIDVRDLDGQRVPPSKKLKPLYMTNVFKKQIDGAEAVIAEVLKENISFDMTISQEISQLVAK